MALVPPPVHGIVGQLLHGETAKGVVRIEHFEHFVHDVGYGRLCHNHLPFRRAGRLKPARRVRSTP